MRRSTVLVSITALLMMPSGASADHGIESARGGGTAEGLWCSPSFCVFLSGSVTLAARDGPGDIDGFYRRFSPVNDYLLHGEVDCLEVSGNTATMSGDVVQQSGDGPIVDRFMVVAMDNGRPDEGLSTDGIIERSFVSGSVTDPTTCVTTPQIGPVAGLLLTRGDVAVHDDV